jgi:arylsulfatase A-like enzyme
MTPSAFSRRNFLKRASLATTSLGISSSAFSRELSDQMKCGSVWQEPASQPGNNLNLILLVSDTFRRDNLECYGSRWVECPNLNQFARDSIIFEDAYPEGMPTIPIRRTLWTGRRILPFHYYRQPEPVQLPGWHHLFNEDITLSEVLFAAGYIPALISDIPHLQRPGRNFHRGYRVYEWIRGQEIDYYGTSPHGGLDVSDIVPAEYLSQFKDLQGFLSQYKANRQRWQKEGESLVEVVARAAIRWLKENHNQRPFFLHVEAFDPHEPWDPPSRFLEKYLPNASGHSWIEPPYEQVKLTEEAKRRMRANYAAETACVDFWLGQVLETIGDLKLFDNSVVVFLADHGALLGEQEQFLKGPEKLRGQVTHIPLLIRMPGRQYAGKRVKGFVQIPDLMPTLLSMLGLKSPSRVTGTNLWPLVSGETRSLREFAVQAYGWIGAVRRGEWNYSQIWKPEAYQGQYNPQLYNLTKDPEELTNVAEKYPDVALQLSRQLQEYMESGEEITRGSFHEEESFRTGTVYVKGAAK